MYIVFKTWNYTLHVVFKIPFLLIVMFGPLSITINIALHYLPCIFKMGKLKCRGVNQLDKGNNLEKKHSLPTNFYATQHKGTSGQCGP